MPRSANGLLALLALWVTVGLSIGACAPEPVLIPVEGWLEEIAVGEGAVWVTQLRLGGVSGVWRIDPTVNKAATFIAVDSLDRPGGIAVGNGGVWVSEGYGGRNVYRIDPRTNRVVASIPIGQVPGAIAVTEGAIWVGGEGTVHRLDPQANRVVASVPLIGRVNSHVMASRDAVLATITSPARVFYRIDPRENRVIATIPIALTPQLAVMWEGSAWVLHPGASPESSTLSRIDLRTNRVLGEPISVGPAQVLTAGAGYLWLANHGEGGRWTVSRWDPQSLRPVGYPIPLRRYASRMAVGFDSLWVLTGRARSSLIQRIPL